MRSRAHVLIPGAVSCGLSRGTCPRGFTLIELMMIVALLAILAAVVVPKFSNAGDAARDTSIRSQLRLLREQIGIFEARTGQAFTPTGASGWDQLLGAGMIRQLPRNEMFGGATGVAAVPGPGIGWLWAGAPPALWGVDSTGTGVWAE